MNQDLQIKLVNLDVHFKNKNDCIVPDTTSTSMTKRLGLEIQAIMNINEAWKVYRAYWKSEKKSVMVKIITKYKKSIDYCLRLLPMELYALKITQAHPFIVDHFATFEGPRAYFLIQEFVPLGSMRDYINKRKFFGEGESKRFFKQLLEAIDYCHERKIAHRDIKLDNIYLDASYNIRLCEFGFAVISTENECYEDSGSILYAAPEVFESKTNGYNPFIADIWSMGVCLFGMLCGKLPFTIPDCDVQIRAVQSTLLFTRLLSKNCRLLIKNMLNVDPNRRCTLNHLRENIWINHSDNFYVQSDYFEDDTNFTPRQTEDYVIARKTEVKSRFIACVFRSVAASKNVIFAKEENLKKDLWAVVGITEEPDVQYFSNVGAPRNKMSFYSFHTGFLTMPMDQLFKYLYQKQIQEKEKELRDLKHSLSGQVARKTRQIARKQVTTLEKNLRLQAAVSRIQREKVDRWREMCRQMLACAATFKKQLDQQIFKGEEKQKKLNKFRDN